MPMMRIAVEVEMELQTDDPAAAFAVLLRGVAENIGSSPDALHAQGSAAGAAGGVRWRVQAWDASDLVQCISCKRMVLRSETDITENGECCQRCATQGEITQHWLQVEQSA